MEYLFNRSGIWYVRVPVPLGLRPVIGKGAIKYSLRTADRHTAAHRGRQAVVFAHTVFSRMRTGGYRHMDQAQIQLMIKKHIQKILDADMHYRINGGPFELVEDMFTGENISHMPEITLLNDLKYQATDQLIRSDYSEVRDQVMGMIADQCGDKAAEFTQEDINQVCHSLLKALPAVYAVLEERALGNFDEAKEAEILSPSPDSSPSPAPVPSGSSEPRPQADPPGLPISELAANYWEDRSPTWKPRSAKDYKLAQERLLEFLGNDTPVTSINYETMKGYRQFLQDRGLSIARINFFIGFAAAVFNHEMKTTGLLNINPCSGLKMKDKRRKDKLRDAFSTEDLSKLFAPDGYTKYAKNPAFFWVPLISLFSGCRQEEACQLYTDQIRKVDDTWCMVIDEEHPEQSVKSSEKREVPLHPFLLKLGLHRYAQEQPHERLWPELKRRNHRYAHYLGRMFGQHKEKCGLSGKVSFHSFRGSVETELREKDVDPVWIDILVGHSVAGEGAGRYLQRKPSVILDKAVSKLEWDRKLDLGPLLNSKFARPE